MTRRSLAFAISLLALAALQSAPADASRPPPESLTARGGQRMLATASAAGSAASALTSTPVGFTVTQVWSGFTLPTAVRFAPGGRVYVAQKDGRVFTFDGLADPTPTLAVDLRTNVDDYWDRGLLAVAPDPQLGAGRNFLYVLYGYDAPPGGTAPTWNDACPSGPNGPGPTTDGCVITGRLSRIPVDPATGVATGPEEPLISNQWCQQFPSHSVGDLRFGTDGALYVSAGDGASFSVVDYGQLGGTVKNPSTGQPYTPVNPCGDPPGTVGTANSAPTARGGSLRAQSPRRPAGEPRLLNGSLLRLDPTTGAAFATNPWAGRADENERRIIAYGLRNPFRFTFRPGTSEVWIADVGAATYEEIDRVVSPTAEPRNFGWPCWEGNAVPGGFANLDLCQALYDDAVSPAQLPFYKYRRDVPLNASDTCRLGSTSITGIEFYTGTSYPPSYRRAMFFGDHSRSCIWVMFPRDNGIPLISTLATFIDDDDAPDPVDIQADPVSGDIVYVDYDSGTINRISYAGTNGGPTAVAVATSPTDGDAPLTVTFDGGSSTDPESEPLDYAWDLDGDGAFDDATTKTATFTYATPGRFEVHLRVSDPSGSSDTTDLPVVVQAGAPKPVISTPGPALRWAVGDTVTFSGSASDQTDGALSGASLVWTLILNHCPSDCHQHIIGTVGTGTSGSFQAPDHSYPASLELRLTATDSLGLTASASITLEPRTIDLTFKTNPAGLQLTVGDQTRTAPFTITVIARSLNSLLAPSPQTLGGKTYRFTSWSDGGAQQHDVAPNRTRTFTARYRR